MLLPVAAAAAAAAAALALVLVAAAAPGCCCYCCCSCCFVLLLLLALAAAILALASRIRCMARWNDLEFGVRCLVLIRWLLFWLLGLKSGFLAVVARLSFEFDSLISVSL